MIFPTLFVLGGLTLVVLTKDMLGYSDLVINRGLGRGDVAWMAFYNTIPLAATVLPFAVLVGCMVALGRLAADHEMLILEASGVSSPRLVGPVMAFAAAMGLVAFALSVFAAPWAVRSLDASLDELALSKPGATLTAGRVQQFGEWRLEATEVSPSGEEMKGVMLWIPDIGETVFARQGALLPDYEGGSRVTIRDGIVVLSAAKGSRKIRFDSMTVDLPQSQAAVQRDEGDRIAGSTMAGLVASIRGEGPAARDPSLSSIAEVELHRRFSLPVATLVFGLLVLPLFLSRAHFSRAGGGVMGILTTVVYYGLVQLGDGLVQGGRVGIPLGVWLPNLLLGVVALVWVSQLTKMTSFGRLSDRPSSSAEKVGRKDDRGPLRPRRWALQRYVALRFVQLAALCFLVVLVAYLLVDVLEQMSWMSRYGADLGEVVRYYMGRIPLLASRVLPMALLVATALTVSLLGAQGELIGMRACGVPLVRALLPILAICSLMVPAYFILSNEVLPYTNALASYLKHIEIKGRATSDGPRDSAWFRIADYVYEAERLDPYSGSATSVTIYELGKDGFPRSRTDAPRAWHIGKGVWRLENPVRTAVGAGGDVQAPAAPFAKLGEDVPVEVDARHLSMTQLREEIRVVESADRDATMLRVDYWSKLAAPIACLLLPALALFFAVAGPPHPSSAMTLVLSIVVAVTYVLLTGVGTSLGYGGALSPFTAGFSSTFLFGAVTLVLGLRLRGFGQGG